MTETLPSDVVGQRIKELRRKRGWSLGDLAEACARAGAEQLTSNAIENIEHGRRDKNRRRRRMVTIDELLAFALALDVAPVHLLVPIDDQTPYAITSRQTEVAGAVRDWVRGFWYLDGVDPRTFLSEVPEQEFQANERYLAKQRESMQRAASARQGAKQLREYAEKLRNDPPAGAENAEEVAAAAERYAEQAEEGAAMTDMQADGLESFMWWRRSGRRLDG